ncbi:hypothetical protein L210DRAFT_3501075 [Boletus edulis BED1]|uniref:Uncharacterized protein n=1 Tax=Boletus edulis BED1 TaxID=1328754 RepID=A0AAD4C2N3_BOLED|nr:hypothetical protein L210DRAFT_3501075 [Boletus edulis BED1]
MTPLRRDDTMNHGRGIQVRLSYHASRFTSPIREQKAFAIMGPSSTRRRTVQAPSLTVPSSTAERADIPASPTRARWAGIRRLGRGDRRPGGHSCTCGHGTLREGQGIVYAGTPEAVASVGTRLQSGAAAFDKAKRLLPRDGNSAVRRAMEIRTAHIHIAYLPVPAKPAGILNRPQFQCPSWEREKRYRRMMPTHQKLWIQIRRDPGCIGEADYTHPGHANDNTTIERKLGHSIVRVNRTNVKTSKRRAAGPVDSKLDGDDPIMDVFRGSVAFILLMDRTDINVIIMVSVASWSWKKGPGRYRLILSISSSDIAVVVVPGAT